MGLERKQEKEHKRDMTLLEEAKFTRSPKKDSLTEAHTLSLTDHVAQTNHTIDLGFVKLPMKEHAWITRGMKESTSIKKMGAHAMNHDEGCHQLSEAYSMLLQ